MGKPPRVTFNNKTTAADIIAAQDPVALAQEPLHVLHALANKNGAVVARLGAWPDTIVVADSLTGRIPTDTKLGSGFDAGIACALGLLPPHAQTLAATLHAAYTPDAIATVRRDMTADANGDLRVKDADSATAWWLAGCAVCNEARDVDLEKFRAQITSFAALMHDAPARARAANEALHRMTRSFDTTRGYAFGTEDGCMQGAYLAGHDMAVMHSVEREMFFVGTFRPTLGLENFAWSDITDDKGRPKSGAVHGSRQFVKCADMAELTRVIAHLQKGPLWPAQNSPKPAAAKQINP